MCNSIADVYGPDHGKVFASWDSFDVSNVARSKMKRVDISV